jgi:hypothetical protein
LLVVVHTNYSMQAYMLELAQAIPREIVAPLVERGFDLRAGILSSDLGGAGIVLPNPGTWCGSPCDRADGTTSSDDGHLLTRPDCWRDGPAAVDWDRADCAAFPHPSETYPAYLVGSDAGFADWFSCLTVRRDGCVIPQPLESLWRALEDGSIGGFLRGNSLLVIVILADADDCSVEDARVLADGGDVQPVGYSGKCAYRQEYLHPVSRYVDRLLALRPADRLLVAAFGGAPQDYSWCVPGEPPTFSCGECVLDRPCLLHVDCVASGITTTVAPAPRLRDFAEGLGMTADGSSVGYSWGSCTLLPGAGGPPSSEAWATFRAAILNRLGLGG